MEDVHTADGMYRLHEETAQQFRGGIARAVAAVVDDTGAVQTVDVATHDDVARSQVEVHQPYGLASLPPDTPLTIVLAVGGDQGHLIALPLASSGYRFGKLAGGEVVLYDAGANRLHLKAGGNIDLLCKTLLHLACNIAQIDAPGGMTVNAAGGVTFNGPVTFTNPVTFNAAVTINANLTVSGMITEGGRPVQTL